MTPPLTGPLPPQTACTSETVVAGGAVVSNTISNVSAGVSQPLASLTKYEYVPTVKLEYTVSEAHPVPLKLTSYGGTPLVASGIIVTEPLFVELQLTGLAT